MLSTDDQHLQIGYQKPSAVRAKHDTLRTVTVPAQKHPGQDQTGQQSGSDQYVEDQMYRRPCQTGSLAATLFFVCEEEEAEDGREEEGQDADGWVHFSGDDAVD
jgi:hypothetical protein